MRNTLRVVVADDEPIARRGLLRMLAKYPEITIVGEAGDGATALQIIRDAKPDVAFLDVQMPGGTGIDVARNLSIDERPAVVFVTAFDKFAIDAFDVHAVDYLLKPFDEDRFALALQRVRERIAAAADRTPDSGAAINDRLDALLATLTANAALGSPAALPAATQAPISNDTFVVRDGERLIFVPLAELDWCEAADNYVRLHAKGKKHLIRETMRNIEERLTNARGSSVRFARIHRSMIVNLSRVREIKPAGGGEYAVMLADGTRLVLSRGYRDRVLGLLGFKD